MEKSRSGKRVERVEACLSNVDHRPPLLDPRPEVEMSEKGNKAKETSSKAPKVDDVNGAELMEGGSAAGRGAPAEGGTNQSKGETRYSRLKRSDSGVRSITP